MNCRMQAQSPESNILGGSVIAIWVHGEIRREVVRSSAGADAADPPFLGVVRVVYPKA